MTEQEQIEQRTLETVIELPEDLRAEIEKNVAKLNEDLQDKKDDLPTYAFTTTEEMPKTYKLKFLTELPSAEFLIDMLNSMRVHVQADTDVYENHPDMFEDA